jgi:putative DNA methylase
MEHYPRKLAEFLEEALPDRERLRLLAQVLGGVGLAGGNGEKTEHQVTTTPAEKATLGKLLANWRHLIEQSLGKWTPRPASNAWVFDAEKLTGKTRQLSGVARQL